MLKWMVAGAGFAALAACTAPPDDTGVGFGSYNARAQARVAGPPPQTVRPPAQPAGIDIAAVAGNAIAAAETAPPPAAPAATAGPGNPAFSDEQDFGAVAARETIESDAERRQAMIDQRIEVAPTALPTRAGTAAPNIIEYALSTSNPVGQQIYRRSALFAGRSARNCLSYRSDNLAQEAFLRLGGPERDRQSLDPDGDGYACGWDPSVFRNAALAARTE